MSLTMHRTSVAEGQQAVYAAASGDQDDVLGKRNTVQTLVVPGLNSTNNNNNDQTSFNSSTVLVSKLNIPRYDAEINSERLLPSLNSPNPN
jgi:hypothetical protein